MSLKYTALLIFFIGNSYGWTSKNVSPAKPPLLILEAGGNGIYPGRSIDDSFEATITLSIVQELARLLHQSHPYLKIYINREPSQHIAPLENASFANRLDPSLYVSIHAFYTPAADKPLIYLYQFSYNDPFIIKNSSLSFYSYDTIYLINKEHTTNFAQQLQTVLHECDLIDMKGRFMLPFKPLIGIKAPAIALELGLKNKDNWRICIEPLVDALISCLLNTKGMVR